MLPTKSPAFHRALAALPVATALLALYVIYTCASLTFASGVLPSRMRYPAISLFAVRPGSPEQQLYAWGFTAVGVLFLVPLVFMRAFLFAHVETELRGEVAKAMWSSVAAFVGLTVHAIVPLHEDILQMLQGVRPSGHNGRAQSTVHQLGAAIFFLLSSYHGFLMISLLWNSKLLPHALSRGGAVARLVFLPKVVTLAAVFVPSLVSLLLHPASRNALGLTTQLDQSDIAGLSQWWAVGCFVMFFASYSFDLFVVANHVGTRTRPDKRD